MTKILELVPISYRLLFKNVVWSGEWEESTVNGTKKIDYITIKQVSATRQVSAYNLIQFIL